VSVIQHDVDHDRNTTAIVDYLKGQGVENPGQYLKGAEYIFSCRQSRTEFIPFFLYDVIVRFPTFRNVPRYLYSLIAEAIRKMAIEDQDVFGVHFMNFIEPFNCYSTIVSDFPYSDPPPPGLNNCFFKKNDTILHDRLRFRSKGETSIYDELKQRNVLFFPNAAAVLGTSGTEYGEKVQKLEPDFLICYKGKWGILEINGDDFHSGVIKTAKDHDRARRFNHYGLYFIQAFPLDRCKNNPSEVVDEFLGLLERYK
jgi:hypothetical protein